MHSSSKVCKLAEGGKKAPFQNQDAVAGNAQGCMMMKPTPIAPFEMSQTEFLLQFFVVALDAPA
jgi:hypothetical protein